MMARIEQITVKNYRVLQNVILKDIQPFSLFLGPNGSGKTTFFDVLGFLSDCLTTNVRKALEKRGRFQEVISRDAKTQEIEFSIKYREKPKNPVITYTLAISQQNNLPIVSRETLEWRRGTHGKPFAFLNFADGGGKVISGENPEPNDRRIEYQIDDPSSLAIKTIGQLSDIVLHRIAIEELESWFLGDVPAICAEYPRVPTSLSQKKQFRDPDGIKGGTWKQLDKILKQYGYETGLQKIEFAQRVAACMDVENNQSKSFQVFRDGLRSIVQ